MRRSNRTLIDNFGKKAFSKFMFQISETIYLFLSDEKFEKFSPDAVSDALFVDIDGKYYTYEIKTIEAGDGEVVNLSKKAKIKASIKLLSEQISNSEIEEATLVSTHNLKGAGVETSTGSELPTEMASIIHKGQNIFDTDNIPIFLLTNDIYKGNLDTQTTIKSEIIKILNEKFESHDSLNLANVIYDKIINFMQEEFEEQNDLSLLTDDNYLHKKEIREKIENNKKNVKEDDSFITYLSENGIEVNRLIKNNIRTAFKQLSKKDISRNLAMSLAYLINDIEERYKRWNNEN